jgi:FMN-dependent NADH-azoreductase
VSKLLYIEASPRAPESGSNQVAAAYLAAFRANNPTVEVDTLRVWDASLPAFDGNKVAAKMKVIAGQEQNAAQKTAWDEIVAIANRFISADRYLFAVPMWNSGIPYKLKHYIDVIHQPGLLWGLDPKTGYFGLLERKHATLVLTAGAFGPELPSPAFGVDHHSTYLRDWLAQSGVTEVDELRFEPTLLTADPAGDLKKAQQRAAELAAKHGRLEMHA